MTIEQRLDQLEKRNKRLTVALTLMAVAMCAVVSFGFSGVKDRAYGAEIAHLFAGRIVTTGISVVTEEEYSKQKKGGMKLDDLGEKVNILPNLLTMNDGENRGHIFDLTPRAVGFYHNREKIAYVGVATLENIDGGMVTIRNKTGEEVVQLYADEYGNGVVGAWNRKGKGRTLKPGP